MGQLKAHEVDRYLARPDAAVAVYLVYGPDHGLVAERCSALLARLGAKADDPFSLIRLDGDAIAGDPGRLVDEALTRSMFGDRRFIRLRVETRPVQAAVDALLKAPLEDAVVVIEAGDLKKSAPLRTMVEKAPRAMAVPCYQDSKAQLEKLIDDEMATSGQRLDADARAMLMRNLGGDRAASRSELRKLSLYAHGQSVITAADVEAICGDASALALSTVVDAMFCGDTPAIDGLTRKLEHEAVSPQALIAAAARHASGLHRATLALAARQPAEAAARLVDPFGSFTRKPVIEQQLRLWSPASALWAIERIGEAQADSRMHGPLAQVLMSRCMVAIAERARRGQRR